MDKITVMNEYSTLKKVILGIAPAIYFPGTLKSELEKESPWWKRIVNRLLYPLLEGKKVPKFIVRRYQKELQAFKQVLLDHQVDVLHPEEIIPPEKNDGLGQMFSRDPLMGVGNTMIAGSLQIAMRQKELSGLEKIITAVEKAGGNVKRVDPALATFIEGGDVMVDLPYIYVGIGRYASNEAGMKWLAEQLGPAVTVIPVYLKNDGILHLDCCLTLIGDKLGVIHRDSLQKPLPFPLNTYNFIEIDRQVRQQMGTNNFLINPETIVVQKRHKKLQGELKRRGFTVIPLSFSWHAALDGAFRCATCPLIRTTD